MTESVTIVKPNNLQQEALISIKKTRRNGAKKALIVLPSGTGKTHFSAFETKYCKGKVLYIAHRIEILKQAAISFQKVQGLDKNDIGFYVRGRKDLNKHVIFSSIQTLTYRNNFEKIRRNHFEYIIIDEFHHVAASSYQKVVKHFRPKFLLGLTATPYRHDQKNILKVVKNNIPYQIELKTAIQQNILVPFVYYGLWDDVDYSKIRWQGHKYNEKDLNRKLLIKKRDAAIIGKFNEKIGDKKTIGFCCSVKHVRRCVREFNNKGISSVGLTHKETPTEREMIINGFKTGQYQVIFTKDIFNEGVDFPDVEALLFLRPTYSKTLFLQQLGRGLRKKHGKKNVIILDFIGNYKNAFMTRHWIEEIVGKGDEHFGKPEYHHNISNIQFDERVLDLFQLQEQPSKEDLINNYENVKKKIGKIPTYYELEKKGVYTKRNYYNVFESYTQFYKYINESFDNKYDRSITKKQLIINYYDVKKKLGKDIVYGDDMNADVSLYGLKRYITAFGSWTTFKLSIKEKLDIYNNSHRKKVTKKDMIQNYYNLKRKLKRNPSLDDLMVVNGQSKYSGMMYAGKFGSFTKFQQSIGIKPRRLNIPTEEILHSYKKACRLATHKIITVKEFNKYSELKYHLIQRRYGTFAKFLKKEFNITIKERKRRKVL